jgi:antitoxin HicB
MSEHVTFRITLRPEPEGGFTVRVPALPEIVTFAQDEEEALAMARDAIQLVLQSRRERGEPVPARDATIVRSVDINPTA